MISSTHFQIEPLALPSRRPTALMISLCLHLAAGLLLFATAKVSSVPFGVNKRGSPTYIEFAPASTVAPILAAPAPVPAIRKVTPRARMTGDVTVKTQEAPSLTADEPQLKPAATPTAPTQFGNESGSVHQGELGDVSGFKATNLERYLYELRVILANRKTYPATSKRLGETGRVVVKFNIRRSGEIENLALQKPSDYSRLNEAALKLVSTVEKYKPFPADEKTESLAVEVPIDYVLN